MILAKISLHCGQQFATTWNLEQCNQRGELGRWGVINKNYVQIKLMSEDLSFLCPYISGSSGRPIKYGQHRPRWGQLPMAVGLAKAKAKAGQAKELSRDFEKLTMYSILHRRDIHIYVCLYSSSLGSNSLDLCQFKETNL